MNRTIESRHAKQSVVCTYRTHRRSVHPVFGRSGHEGKDREMHFLLLPLVALTCLLLPLDARRFFERILLTVFVGIGNEAGFIALKRSSQRQCSCPSDQL